MPTQKRLLHATEYLGSETMDCDFDFKNNVRGDVEKAITNIIKFHEIAYVVSTTVNTGSVSENLCCTLPFLVTPFLLLLT